LKSQGPGPSGGPREKKRIILAGPVLKKRNPRGVIKKDRNKVFTVLFLKQQPGNTIGRKVSFEGSWCGDTRGEKGKQEKHVLQKSKQTGLGGQVFPQRCQKTKKNNTGKEDHEHLVFVGKTPQFQKKKARWWGKGWTKTGEVSGRGGVEQERRLGGNGVLDPPDPTRSKSKLPKEKVKTKNASQGVQTKWGDAKSGKVMGR